MTTIYAAQPIRLAVIAGTTRPNRRSRMVAEWVVDQAREHLGDQADVRLVDLADFALPMLDEPAAAAIADYRNDHTRRWSQTIAGFDAFVFVTPEYNHSMPASVKNAVDYLFGEWNDKAAGFVSYGFNGGVRAVEHLRLTLAEVKVAGVRSQVALDMSSDFDLENMIAPGRFTPSPKQTRVLERMLGELTSWAGALRTVRTGVPA
ncbi:NADPH-dependent FMN reductase [Gordonia neofelifaecis]|uniref:Putative reductase n=1 Tax=Gordonia neofelifaecis NRRL B-59395 TaxID=644548 RepID=F1YH62_9ACTN|nr:NAD(P)H-dependent oxidoreductase [Gordonia neofelifaecis]EGD55977.1 putative reductase [Gordonia neofelifaecis NRRL B-59395]